MQALKRVNVNGWALDVADDGEPRVLDVDLGARLGFARPRDLRKLVERMLSAGILNETHVRATVARQDPAGGWGGHRKAVTEYHLTQKGALKVIAKSDTATANAILDEMVDVFDAYRRGVLAAAAPPAPPPPPVVQLDVAHGPRVGELPNVRADLAAHCVMVSRASGRSIRAIHGYVRRLYRVPGVYHLSALIWPLVRQTLTDIALAPERLAPPAPPPRKALRLLQGGAPDPKQLDMFPEGRA